MQLDLGLVRAAPKSARIAKFAPNASATTYWIASQSIFRLSVNGIGGKHHGRMKGADYMSAPVMVDAALAGLDLGEFATIPSLPESSDRQTYASARQA